MSYGVGLKEMDLGIHFLSGPCRITTGDHKN